MRSVLYIDPVLYDRVWKHLLPEKPDREETAFLFARSEQSGDTLKLIAQEDYLVQPRGFATSSLYYLELAEETHRLVVKEAFQNDSCLVELHSHPYPRQACFSPSDWSGFDEFVPYIRWRLPGRPYTAVVVAPDTFDGLVWNAGYQEPMQLDSIVVDQRFLYPTGLSFSRRWEPEWTKKDINDR